MLPSLGDAARYFRDHPSNEDESRHIRKIVIDKLRKLHELDDQGEPLYARVIVIGHSLGSLIGYDALNHFWAETQKKLSVGAIRDCQTCRARNTAALALEKAAHELVSLEAVHGETLVKANCRPMLAAYRTAQWELGRHLRSPLTSDHHAHLRESSGPRSEPVWLVSDFITVGSPLASVSFLAERAGQREGPTAPDSVLTQDDVRVLASWFGSKLADREYPSCPPLPQTTAAQDPILLFSDYPLRYALRKGGNDTGRRYLHHAAAFGPTRWTNVYFENDLAGGPVSGQLGRGILDVQVRVAPPTPRYFVSLYPHSSYWEESPIKHLREPALRSRQVLADLVDLSGDVIEPEVRDVPSREDLVWCQSSPAQLAATRALTRLTQQRKAAVNNERRTRTWTETLAILQQDLSPDGVALFTLLEGVRERHRGKCFAVAAFGEVALYRLTDEILDRSEYLTLAVSARSGEFHCRWVTSDRTWPGDLEDKAIEAAGEWVKDFLT